MAIFIKKERLGSGAPPRRVIRAQNPHNTLREIESTEHFKQVERNLAEAKERRIAELRQQHESSAEVQRWRHEMTPEERTRDAIERMIPTTKAVEEMRSGGKEVSYEDARKKAESLAYKSERQKKGE